MPERPRRSLSVKITNNQSSVPFSSGKGVRGLGPLHQAHDDTADSAPLARLLHGRGSRTRSGRQVRVLRAQPIILFSGNSTIPTAPASSNFGNSSRTVASAITVSTASHCTPLSALDGYRCEIVGAVIDGSSAITFSRFSLATFI